MPVACFLPLSFIDQTVLKGLFSSFTPQGATFEDFVGMVAEGNLQVYVVEPETFPVYFAFSTIESFGRKVLWIEAVWVAGEGGWRWRTWREFFQAMCKAWDCVAVSTSVQNMAMARGMKLMGARPVAVVVELEVHDG